MLLSETAKVLAKIQLIDNRVVDRVTIDTWHEIIGHFDYADALEALNLHRLESTDYVEPGHIKQNMTRAKAMRKTKEARQRAILTSRARDYIANMGEEPTPILMEAVREMLANATEQAGELVQFNKPEHTSFADEPEPAPEPAPAPLNLYERLANSPEGRESIQRGNFLKSA